MLIVQWNLITGMTGITWTHCGMPQRERLWRKTYTGVSTHSSATSSQWKLAWLCDYSDCNRFVCLATGWKGCEAAETHSEHHKTCGPCFAHHVDLLLGQSVLERSCSITACVEVQICSSLLMCTQCDTGRAVSSTSIIECFT